MPLFCLSCGKDFLDEKRNANQVVPGSIKDYLAILSRESMLTSSNSLAYYGSDEYYIPTYSDLVSIANSSNSPMMRNIYVWADDIYEADVSYRHWNTAYECIAVANLALDVEKIVPSVGDVDDWNRTRIAARFFRAWNFYQLAQQFCKVFDESTADSDLGLPLRLDYDLSVKYNRSTLGELYAQILKDLHDADEIGEVADENIYLPGRSAVHALLARVYLQMGKYDAALQYAELVLAKNSTLLDFNALDATITNEGGSYFPPYAKENPEVILYINGSPGGLVSAVRFNADTSFVATLDQNDLRRKVFFFERNNGTRAFIGSYSGRGGNNLFSGFSVNEMLLIRAECYARKGDAEKALQDLNYLREHRYRTGTYSEIEIKGKDVVREVLMERRKELYMRSLRWEDARRLNREGQYLVTFRRNLDGNVTELLPNSRKWVWPIPPNEIMSNGLEQNER